MKILNDNENVQIEHFPKAKIPQIIFITPSILQKKKCLKKHLKIFR